MASVRISIPLIASLLALTVAGCGSAAAAPASSAGKEARSSRPARKPAAKVPRYPGTRVKARGSEYGKVLVDARGRTLYLLDSETDGRSECYGDCAKAWPPLLTGGAPKARGDAKQALLGRTNRRGGGRQVTYRGHPLYRYAPEGPRQILCQNVFEFGGTWLVVKPTGNPVR